MFTLMKLPYATDSLNPYIDTLTVETHYGKHHAGYVKKLNAALENYPDLLSKSIEDLVGDYKNAPAEIKGKIRNIGGQVYNHNIYWTSMTPNGSSFSEDSELLAAINDTFGSFVSFIEQFPAAAASQFGSGWAWLSVSSDKKLEIDATANGDSPLMDGKTPILGIDVWEHAYYITYQNRRPEYIESFLKIADWKSVEVRFNRAMG